MTTNEQAESDELVTIREAFAQFMYEPGTGRDIPDWRADFDVWLAGERHRVREEGRAAWAKYEQRCEDAAAAGLGVNIDKPRNPYDPAVGGSTEGRE